MSTDDILIDDWEDLYRERWGSMITKEAYQHPAKFARGLIRAIYQHMVDEGWVEAGGTVLDPFAGVALGALHAMYHGLHWIGVELENGEDNAYVDWGRANIEKWNEEYGQHFDGWGTAVLIQGDSRFLVNVLQEAHCSVASPPYGDSDTSAQGAGPDQAFNDAYREYLRTGDATKFQEQMSSKSAQAGYGRHERGQLANMPYGDVEALLSSPGYSGTRIGSDSRQEQIGNREAYGETEGQMGRMPEGDLDATIASPPFQQQTGGTNITAKSGPLADAALHKRHAAGNAAKHAYGETDGQLQTMNEGDLDATVASPPYGGVEVLNFTGKKPASEQSYSSKYIAQDVGYGETDGQLSKMEYGDLDGSVSSPPYMPKDDRRVPWGHTQGKTLEDYDEERGYQPISTWRGNYGDNPQNLGNPTGADQSTFWEAAFQIVQQVYQVLRPGGHAVWVVKAYVKDWEIVDFPGQWQRLCEAAGFKTVHIHRAWQVDDRGTQLDMFGGAHTKLVEHKSYFRRNMEQKGSPRIDYEIVLCMEKPSGDDV